MAEGKWLGTARRMCGEENRFMRRDIKENSCLMAKLGGAADGGWMDSERKGSGKRLSMGSEGRAECWKEEEEKREKEMVEM